jgi:hypothetical protein
METHLRKQGISQVIDCEELQTKGYVKAFKVGIPLTDLQKAGDS